MKKKAFAALETLTLIVSIWLAVWSDFTPVLAQYSWTDTIKIYENITVVYTNIRTIINNETFPIDVKAYVTSTSGIHLLQFYKLSANGTDFIVISEGALIHSEDAYYGLGTGQKLCFIVEAKPRGSMVIGDTATVGIKVELYPARIYAQFTLLTLYKLNLYVNGTLVYGNSVKVRFYSYSGVYESEVTVWSGTTPTYVTLSMNITHPLSKGIENVTLVLTDEAGTTLETLATFLVRRSHLFSRIAQIDTRWSFAPPSERTQLFLEIVDIDMQWPYAPP